MPRSARGTVGGTCYHVYSRTIEPIHVFGEPAECCKFVELLDCVQKRNPLELLAACVMPNHFHLVVRPRRNADLGRWMHWLLTTHVRRWHSQQRSSGPIWQSRFKAFPIAPDEHLLSVMRYVEANALRARLVARAEQWPWSSLNWRRSQPVPVVLTAPPLPLPRDWIEQVNGEHGGGGLAPIRLCLNRQRPFGDPRLSACAESLPSSMPSHSAQCDVGEEIADPRP